MKRGRLHTVSVASSCLISKRKGMLKASCPFGCHGMFNQDIFRIHSIANHSKNNIKTKIIHLIMYCICTKEQAGAQLFAECLQKSGFRSCNHSSAAAHVVLMHQHSVSETHP